MGKYDRPGNIQAAITNIKKEILKLSKQTGSHS
jgi:hypothetical protein